MADFKLYNGDCLEVLAQLPDNSVEAVVTDPPSGIFFIYKWGSRGITTRVAVTNGLHGYRAL